MARLTWHWIVSRLTGLRDRLRFGAGRGDELAVLAPLLQLVPPAPPPVGLLARVEAQIDSDERQPRATDPEYQTIWAGIRMFSAGVIGALAGAAVAALLALSIFPPECAPVRLTTLEIEQQPFSLRIDCVECGRYLRLQHNGSSKVAGHALELWLVPQSGGVQKSLGLLSAKGNSTILPLRFAILVGDALAISQEPLAGSPFDRPSGPVLASGVVRRGV